MNPAQPPTPIDVHINGTRYSIEDALAFVSALYMQHHLHERVQTMLAQVFVGAPEPKPLALVIPTPAPAPAPAPQKKTPKKKKKKNTSVWEHTLALPPSENEVKIAALIRHGRDNRAIADEIGFMTSTVGWYKSLIRERAARAERDSHLRNIAS